jgi:hypothetical protein
MKINRLGLGLLGIAALLISACGNSQLTTTEPPAGDTSVQPPFSLASDFPADIVIADIDGMRSTAFVVSTSSPAGVLAVDIDANPMQISDTFAGLISPAGSGIPSKLLIVSATEAYMLTSTSIISFDPTSGSVRDTVDALEPVDVIAGLVNSDGSDAGRTIIPSYPGGIAKFGNKLFVSSANFIRTQTPAVTAPGTVQIFTVNDNLTLRHVGHIITTGYNPTGLTIRNNAELLITNSGVIDIVDAQSVPQTESSIDIISLDGLEKVTNIDLGLAAANFQEISLSFDGSRGFLGSSSKGYIFEIDFINRQILRGLDDPIVATAGSDYITDVALSVDDGFLFAASFEQSAVYPFDLSTPPVTAGNGFVVGFPSGVTSENPSGANTGAGPIAVRPGSKGIDYEGADLYVLTGYPGTIVAVDSATPAQAPLPIPQEEVDDDTPTPEPPDGNDGDACQGFAQAVDSVDYGDGAGFGQASFPDVVLGPPRGNISGGGGMHVLSLGQRGEIVLDLGNCPMVDGPGADFIVFENAFYISGNPEAPFAELAEVGVSEDGINFTWFDCNSDAYPYDGCSGWHPVYSNPDNGISPFDVDEAGGEAYDLSDIGITDARYVIIRDLNDSGGGGTAGYDLDALSVINGEINN